MSNDPSSPLPGSNLFTEYQIQKLRNHPKRIVFTEGEDLRVLRAAQRLVDAEAAVPVLLGNREAIRGLAKENGVSLKFINVIEPAKASDFGLFCQRFAKVERYRKLSAADPGDVIARPHYFGAMMVQYGHADALVGGNKTLPASLFRALLHTIPPLPGVPKMFGMMVLVAPHLQHFGSDGILFLADCGLIPQPSVDQLASIAIETGSNIAVVHAVDALDPSGADFKLPEADRRGPADVLVFPNLDAAHISLKLLQHCAGAINYGQILAGLARPCAQVPRTASEETIFGTAAAVAVEAIKYHQLYPEGEV